MDRKYLIKPLAILALGLFTTASYATGTATGVAAPTSAVQGSLVTIIIMADVSRILNRGVSPKKTASTSPVDYYAR